MSTVPQTFNRLPAYDLIYFDKATQRHLLERLAMMLCRDGYLMLGHAESIHGFDHLYRPVGYSIYQVRKGSVS